MLHEAVQHALNTSAGHRETEVLLGKKAEVLPKQHQDLYVEILAFPKRGEGKEGEHIRNKPVSIWAPYETCLGLHHTWDIYNGGKRPQTVEEMQWIYKNLSQANKVHPVQWNTRWQKRIHLKSVHLRQKSQKSEFWLNRNEPRISFPSRPTQKR